MANSHETAVLPFCRSDAHRASRKPAKMRADTSFRIFSFRCPLPCSLSHHSAFDSPLAPRPPAPCSAPCVTRGFRRRWISTRRAIAMKHGGGTRRIPQGTGHGLRDDSVIAVERWAQLWVGSRGRFCRKHKKINRGSCRIRTYDFHRVNLSV
jgi:hypothetical protein